MKVMHVIPIIAHAAGGTSTAFIEIIESLRTTGGRVQPVAVTTKLAASDPTLAKINGHESGIWWFGESNAGFSGGDLTKLVLDVLARERPRVVHLHGLWNPSMVKAAQAARRAGAAVVWQTHGMLVREALLHSQWKKRLFLVLGLGRELRNADAAIFTSEYERDTSRLSLLGARTRRVVLPLPVNAPFFEAELPALRARGRELLGLHDESPTLVFMGRLHKVKRVALTIRALAQASATLPKARLVLVGDGDDEHVAGLRALAEELGVLPRVVFAGFRSGMDKWATLAAGDALIINSEFENFGYVIVEALLAGTPVVMTDNLSLAEQVRAAGAGAVSAPEATALGQAAARLLTDPDRQAMGRRGRNWVLGTFSREAMGRQLCEFYESIVSATPSTTRQ